MEKEYRFKIPEEPTGGLVISESGGMYSLDAPYAIAERLERMVEEQAAFHIALLSALSDLGKRLKRIQKAAPGR